MTFQLYSGRFCRKAESSERCSGVSVYDKKRSKLKIIENLRLSKKSRIAGKIQGEMRPSGKKQKATAVPVLVLKLSLASDLQQDP